MQKYLVKRVLGDGLSVDEVVKKIGESTEKGHHVDTAVLLLYGEKNFPDHPKIKDIKKKYVGNMVYNAIRKSVEKYCSEHV